MVGGFIYTILHYCLLTRVRGYQYQYGKTTRYWDCCKPSCAWNGKAQVDRPVQTCSTYNKPYTCAKGTTEPSGCDGGDAFACSSQAPFVTGVTSTVAYGFAAAHIGNLTEQNTCCSCYELLFTEAPVQGKKMLVQIINTGGDLGYNHFDLAIPGGGQGLFFGCSRQYKNYTGGARYGGVKNVKECYLLPRSQLAGCLWRFGWFKNAENPNVMFTRVACPKILTDISKCKRIPNT